jgi:hypothetical protein
MQPAAIVRGSIISGGEYLTLEVKLQKLDFKVKDEIARLDNGT